VFSLGGLLYRPHYWTDAPWHPILVFTSLLFTMVFPASLLLLPITLAKCRIKKTHLIRIAFVSILSFMPWLALYALLRVLAHIEFWALAPSTRQQGPWGSQLPPIWLDTLEGIQNWVSWNLFDSSWKLAPLFFFAALLPTLSAVLFYLRIPNRLVVAFLMLVLSVLLSCLISFVLGGLLPFDLDWTYAWSSR
ncbi:MAG: hypothetical protein AAGB34_09835, partial [Planctomycetota bacterium]